MTILWARQALLAEGWVAHVRVEIDADGRIASVRPGQPPEGTMVDILLPAPVNAHSHAFQRAMAGLTEGRGPGARDSFWTWRQLMFRFLDRLTPDHVEAIAALVQMEMLESGYATNVEFHYLHHQPGGAPYGDIAEMATRICAAAGHTGIGLTLLPVFYQYGGCDGRPLGEGQVRFGNDMKTFARLHERSEIALKQLPMDAVLGVAPHSLRAVGRDDLPTIANLAGPGPVHMHLAEQIAEVEEVEAAHGARPVEWFLENIEDPRRWCLIHCTQMLPQETEALARSGAVAGLCPITESSLGDGIFDGVCWLEQGGAVAIGSDSNIRISLSEELRILEYSQRLRDRSRAVLATPEKPTGRRLFDAICTGGARAAGRETGRIEAGCWADLLALDADNEHLAGRSGDTLLDTWFFAADDRLVTDVWSAGRHVVREGAHLERGAIVERYRRVIAELGDAM